MMGGGVYLRGSFVAVLAGGLVACGGIGGENAPPQQAIYATTAAGRILTFPVLTELQGYILGAPSSVAGPTDSDGLAIVPLGGLQYAMYVSHPAGEAIRVYSIGPSSNQPVPVNIGPFPLGDGNGSPGTMVSGGPLGDAFLYVATSHGTIAGFSIGADGALTPVAGAPAAAGAGIAAILATTAPVPPSAAPATCLYASDSDDPNGGISAFRVQGNGALATVAGSPFATIAGGSPEALFTAWLSAAGSPAEVLYVALGNAGSISGFSVGGDCSLTPLTRSPFAAGGGVASLFGGGAALFAANSGDGTVSSYTIDQTTGDLAPVASQPFTGVMGSDSGTLDVNGMVLLPNAANDSVAAFLISNAGTDSATLTPLPGSPFHAGSGTLALASLFRPVKDPP
jgi:6-phosphogluconolactonase